MMDYAWLLSVLLALNVMYNDYETPTLSPKGVSMCTNVYQRRIGNYCLTTILCYSTDIIYIT